ncbi:uncharacterized protein BT62DRAFT_621805 [Guyanagaster necrorhizus]|uniref:Uncharacterized protein n=1 Tax=Guyanagaster necrorhizus TaxID=856835 RepID=A0A9P7VZY5_9AGAR|nr:uncharacterized protein BT62DRAFT_621805 [Guyanagaster necrorhizus MCA 3950]KAG7450062.1 hypothetical protein BT62DRAFT_621805 [Guyanagaster necrorhizus MCA 3950]
MLRRLKRKLRERQQRHPPIEYFADGCPIPKDHPDVDEIILYPQLDSGCQPPLKLPHAIDTNSGAFASSDRPVLSGGDRKDLAIPSYGPMRAFHFVDNKPPASETSFHDLPIDHAALGYTTTTFNPFSGHNPQGTAFPPQTKDVAIPNHYGHHLVGGSHKVPPSVRFNPFADDGPIVDQRPSDRGSYSENANGGRPVLTDPFNNSIILDHTTFGMAQWEHIQPALQHQYAAIPTERANIQAAEHDQGRSYPNNQYVYSQCDTIRRTNTGDSSASSSSRTLVNNSDPVIPKIFYWVDRFNKAHMI